MFLDVLVVFLHYKKQCITFTTLSGLLKAHVLVFQTEEHKQLRSNREIIDKEYMKKICEDHHSITESSIYNSNSTISLQLHKQMYIHIIEYTKKNERKNNNSV